MSMLLLTRHVGESVVLTDSDTGTVLGELKIMGLTPSEVRIGFRFPKNVTIMRDDANVMRGAAYEQQHGPRKPTITTVRRKGNVSQE